MSRVAPIRLTAIDAHAAGGVLRLVTGGIPAPRGGTMVEKARSLAKQSEPACRALLLEPRGHEGIVLGVLCEPVAPDADAGVLFRHAGGSLPFCGHGLIAATTTAIERRLIVPRAPGVLRLDTGIGAINLRFDAEPTEHPARVRRVRYLSPPSFVLSGGVALRVGTRTVRADIACGGTEHLVIADSESAGVPLAHARLHELKRAAAAILQAAGKAVTSVHPVDRSIRGLAGVVFTGPPERAEAQLRCQVIYADGAADRSPSGTGVSAIVAVLHAMGLARHEPVTIESLVGTLMTGRVVDSVQVAETAAVRVEIEASAWITAEHEFVIDPEDPLARGIR